MGATKKRRNTKHRGNAAGMVEARGNTGAGRSASPSGSGGRGAPRVPKEANWNSAALKGLIAVAVLAVFLLLTGKDKGVGTIIPFLILGFLVYVPAVYYMDRFMYNRYQKRGR